jgi:predicted amidophosphoribosyltransferase
MSPRILDTRTCPHCKAQLPQPTPRVCPSCAGSLQKRFLQLGCLTTAPKVLLIAALVWAIGSAVLRAKSG